LLAALAGALTLREVRPRSLEIDRGVAIAEVPVTDGTRESPRTAGWLQARVHDGADRVSGSDLGVLGLALEFSDR
jgi:hypothetical protein